MNRPAQHRYSTLLANMNGKTTIQELRVMPKSQIQHDLVKYFKLSYQDTERVSMIIHELDSNENPSNHGILVFTVTYTTKTPFTIIDGIPLDISRKIHAYISYSTIQLTFTITFTETYPFTPPKWSLKDENSIVSNVSNLSIPIRDYYQELVNNHNNQYKRSPDLDTEGSEPFPFSVNDPHTKSRYAEYYYWTPAYTIEKDILNFIMRINHFEYILQKLEILNLNYGTNIRHHNKKHFQSWKFMLV